MPAWPALLLAPLVALADLSVIYALVTPSCQRQDRSALHGVAALSLLVVLVLTAMAWQAWRRSASSVTAADSDPAAQRPRFVALVATLVGALSVLVCVALWLPVWMLSPCW